MKNKSSVGFFLPALTLIFTFCKLTGYINWNWFFVLSPLLIPLGIFMLLMMYLGCKVYFMAQKKEKSEEEMIYMVNKNAR